jgi:nicotinamide-nucleotide amidase
MPEDIWAEVATIGSELVLGQLVDTNAAFIAASLSEIGVGLAFHTTVGDDWERMIQALETATHRCDLVITTGGIGPTEDDFTREAAAAIMGVPLVLKPELLAHIESLFQRLGYKMKENNKKQAYIPQGAEPIHNPYGTAPGFYAPVNNSLLICLPGVPQETERLMRQSVIPLVKQRFTPQGRVWVNRVLKVVGVGESNVDDQIRDIIREARNPTIGLQASPMEIKVRLTARADRPDQAETMLDETEARIKAVLGPLIFGRGEQTLAGVTAGLLTDTGRTLALAESVSRGLVAAELGRGLPPDVLTQALILNQPQPVERLVQRLFDETGADAALAVTGDVGENGRTESVILARDRSGRERRRELSLGGSQRMIMDRTASMALYTLYQFLKEDGAFDTMVMKKR